MDRSRRGDGEGKGKGKEKDGDGDGGGEGEGVESTGTPDGKPSSKAAHRLRGRIVNNDE